MVYKFDYDNILKHKKGLEKHNGLIPLALCSYLDMSEYYKNLHQHKDYEKINKSIHKRREKIQFMDTDSQLQFEEKEIYSFIKNNPRYKNIIQGAE